MLADQHVHILGSFNNIKVWGPSSGVGVCEAMRASTCCSANPVLDRCHLKLCCSLMVLSWQLARDAICSLILGSPPGKVYNQMRNVAKRLAERF